MVGRDVILIVDDSIGEGVLKAILRQGTVIGAPPLAGQSYRFDISLHSDPFGERSRELSSLLLEIGTSEPSRGGVRPENTYPRLPPKKLGFAGGNKTIVKGRR